MKTILEKKFEIALGFNRQPLSHAIVDKVKGCFFGMNAILWVGVSGPINPKTGFIIEISQFKKLFENKVIKQIDHSFFENKTENEIFEHIIETSKRCFEQYLPELTLHHINLLTPSGLEYGYYNDEQSIQLKVPIVDVNEEVIINGDNQDDDELCNVISKLNKKNKNKSMNSVEKTMQVLSINDRFETLKKEIDNLSLLKLKVNNQSIDTKKTIRINGSTCFSGTHQLISNQLTKSESEEMFGKCGNLHGHDFKLDVVVNQTGLDNPEQLESLLKSLKTELDGKHYNQLNMFKDNVCTCENMLHYIWQFIQDHTKISIQSLTLTETFNNRFKLIK